MVWRTVYRLLDNREDASDCFQETFLEYARRSRRSDVANPSAMLRSIATARAIDRLRSRARQRKWINVAADLQAIASRTADDPAQQAEDAEIAGRLRTALAELPRQQSQAYALRFFDELTYQEIARAMGLTTQSVGVLLHRARNRLRELLSDWSPAHSSSARADKQT